MNEKLTVREIKIVQDFLDYVAFILDSNMFNEIVQALPDPDGGQVTQSEITHAKWWLKDAIDRENLILDIDKEAASNPKFDGKHPGKA